MQLGCCALEIGETMLDRLAHVPDYIRGFTGQDATAEELEHRRSLIRIGACYALPDNVVS